MPGFVHVVIFFLKRGMLETKKKKKRAEMERRQEWVDIIIVIFVVVAADFFLQYLFMSFSVEESIISHWHSVDGNYLNNSTIIFT